MCVCVCACLCVNVCLLVISPIYDLTPAHFYVTFIMLFGVLKTKSIKYGVYSYDKKAIKIPEVSIIYDQSIKSSRYDIDGSYTDHE